MGFLYTLKEPFWHHNPLNIDEQNISSFMLFICYFIIIIYIYIYIKGRKSSSPGKTKVLLFVSYFIETYKRLLKLIVDAPTKHLEYK